MEGSFSFKNIKPTLSTPTKAGRQMDTNFKKQIRQTGMPIKENTPVINEKEKQDKSTSLKKRIFKLDKMETLVHGDEMLSKKFDDLKGIDPDLKWGYHWNEVILNLLFNDYVLNSPRYLQKYKNTRAKEKTRRGEEGIAQLQHDLDKEKEATTGAEERKNDLMSAADSEELNELFGFSSKSTPAPSSPRSQNDQYFIDGSNRIVAVAPYLDQQQYKQVISQYAGKPNIKQVPWFAALHGSPMTNNQPVNGVPAEVSDFDQSQAQQSQQQFSTVPAMVREESVVEDCNCPPPAKPFRNPNDPMASFSKLGETTGSGNSGAFSMGLDAVNKEISDRTYQNETTTSSSSGQYSGPAIWAKNPTNSRFAHKPAWKGGKILEESVIKGDMNYLTDPTAFKKYVIKAEIINMMNEDYLPEANEIFQQHAQRMYGKLNQYAIEDPTLKSDPHFQEMLTMWKHQAETGQAYQDQGAQTQTQTAQVQQPVQQQQAVQTQQPVQQQTQTPQYPSWEQQPAQPKPAVQKTEPTAQWKQPVAPMAENAPIEEHHLNTRIEKLQFIAQNADATIEQLAGLSDQEIDALYLDIEHNMGMNENGADDKSELYREIEARLSHSDHALPFDEINDLANQFGVNFEDVSDVMMQVIGHRHNAKQEDASTVVADALKELGHNAQNFVDFNQLMSYLHQNYDMNGYDQDQLEMAYEKLTRDPYQMALFEASNFKEVMVKDLNYTGRKASDNDSTEELESKDGLFKGKWNDNKNISKEPVAETVKIQQGHADDKFKGKGGVEFSHTHIPTSNSLKPKDVKKIKEGFGGDPEVGEDQYQDQRETSEFMTLEKQLQQLAALKREGRTDELRAMLNSMPVIPMANHAGNYDELGHRDLEDLGYLRVGYDNSGGENDLEITNVSKKPIAQLNHHQHTVYTIEPGQMMESKKDTKELISEKSVSKAQQKFMGMVHAAQKGKLKHPSSKVVKAAEEMKDKDAEDFASTKHKGLPNHVKKDKKKEKVDESIFGNNNSGGELNVDQIAQVIDGFKRTPDSQQMRDQFIKAKDFVKAKAGNVVKLPQLKMWLDQNMPQLSNYVGLLWGNWDLMPTNKLSENTKEMKINQNEYKELIKAKMKSSGKSLRHMSDDEKKQFFNEADGDYHQIKESMIDDQPDSMINNQEDSMANSMNSDEVNSDGSAPEDVGAGEVDGVEETYDTDDLSAKPSVKDKMADYSDEEPTGEDDPTGAEEPKATVAPAELHRTPSYYNQGTEDSQVAKDAEKFRAALKAKYGVDSVSDLSNAERLQVMQNMNFANKEKKGIDPSNFAKSDAEKANYARENDPSAMLDYLNKNMGSLQTPQDFKAVASQFKAATGKQMQHPMAIYGAIEQMSPEVRSKYAGLENYFKANMSKGMNENWNKKDVVNPKEKGKHSNKSLEELRKQLANAKKEKNTSLVKELDFAIRAKTGWGKVNEDRTPSAILNVEKLGAENAKNFNADKPKEDALSQEKTYPHSDGLHKAQVWPDPSKFYIEQGKGNTQELAQQLTKDAKTMADLESEQLAKTKGSLNNIGNATADGKNIPKRNLTPEEKQAVAFNRGDGMQDIVYDNKPSDKFEKRMEQDLGKDIYKLRNDKMKYKADAPMYNKDTQPTEKGHEKEEDNKFDKGYNLHEFNGMISGRYKDNVGRSYLVEFDAANVEVTETVNEESTKLSVDGMGNKYSLIGKKINENVGYEQIASTYEFYLLENKVYAVRKTEQAIEDKKQVVNESKLNKMKHLMNYAPKGYVDSKKSVKF